MAKYTVLPKKPLPRKKILEDLDKILDLYDKRHKIWDEDGIPRLVLIKGLDKFNPSGESFEQFITNCLCGEKNEKAAPGNGPYKYNKSHQWILWCHPEAVDEKAKKVFALYKEKPSIFRPTDFDDFYNEIEKLKVDWYGPVCNYDFCLRYCWNQNPKIEPVNFVYVHTKPEDSAKILVRLQVINPYKKGKIPMSSFPDIFRKHNMSSKDIENFLCVFKNELVSLSDKYSSYF